MLSFCSWVYVGVQLCSSVRLSCSRAYMYTNLCLFFNICMFVFVVYVCVCVCVCVCLSECTCTCFHNCMYCFYAKISMSVCVVLYACTCANVYLHARVRTSSRTCAFSTCVRVCTLHILVHVSQRHVRTRHDGVSLSTVHVTARMYFRISRTGMPSAS